MDESLRMILGLALGIVVMIMLVMKTKVHTFMALLIAAMITGLIGGMSISDVVGADGKKVTGLIGAITSGFGTTLASTGIIVGLGVMMGGILEKSGGAEKLAFTFIKFVGQKREEWALALTGWVVSIPVFADSALLIFAPVCKGLSEVTGKSVVGLALALASGLQIAHCMIPPTPGPLAAAGLLNVDIGEMILLGMVVSVPMLIPVIFYSKWIGKKIYQIPNPAGGYIRKDYKEEYIRTMSEIEATMSNKKLPSFSLSLAPIVVPLLLIFIRTIWNLFKLSNSSSSVIHALGGAVDFFGNPVTALMIGTLIAIYGVGLKDKRKSALKIMDEATKSSGMIMLITGAGGSLGNVIKVSGLGDVLGQQVAHFPISAVLIPFIIAALMRIALGSATVAIITAATLTAPLIPSLGISPLLMAQAACVGAISFSYFNDSGFWVFNSMFGVTELKDQILCKFNASMIMSFTGLIILLILQFFFKV